MSNIIVFKDGNLEVATKVEQDSIWLTQKELCLLFDRDKSVISRHINNVFKSGELDKDSVVAKNATTASDGKTYQVEYYNKKTTIAENATVQIIGAFLFVSLALLIATSNPSEKEMIIKLIMNLLCEDSYE